MQKHVCSLQMIHFVYANNAAQALLAIRCSKSHFHPSSGVFIFLFNEVAQIPGLQYSITILRAPPCTYESKGYYESVL